MYILNHIYIMLFVDVKIFQETAVRHSMVHVILGAVRGKHGTRLDKYVSLGKETSHALGLKRKMSTSEVCADVSMGFFSSWCIPDLPRFPLSCMTVLTVNV